MKRGSRPSGARCAILAAILLAGCQDPPPTSTAPSAVIPSGLATTATSGVGTASAGAEAWAEEHQRFVAAGSASAALEQPPPIEGAKRNVDAFWWHGVEPRLAFAQGKRLHIVDVRKPSERRTVDAADAIRSIRWASTAPRIAVVSRGIEVWNDADGQLVRKIDAPAGDHFSISPNGRHAALDLKVWRVDDGSEIALDEPMTGMWGMELVADNKHIAAVDFGGVAVWNLESRKRVHEKSFATGATSPIGLSPDGAFVAVSLQIHHLVSYRLSTTTETPLESVDSCLDHLSGIGFAGNSKLLKVQAASGWWRSWNLPTLSPRTSFTPQPGAANSFMSDDGGTVIVERDGKLEVWDAYKNQKRDTLEGNLAGAWVSFSSDSRYVAISHEQLTVLDLNGMKRIPIEPATAP